MKRGRGEPIPPILIKIPKEDKGIYELKELFSLDVSVDPL